MMMVLAEMQTKVNYIIQNSSHQEIIHKVSKAHAVKLAWKELGAQKRVRILRYLVAALKTRQDDIAKLICHEINKPITECYEDMTSEFAYLEAFLNDGPSYIDDIITYKDQKSEHRIIFEPRGVVASVAPWNYPLSNFIWAVIPNLIVGNTVIFKHSELCQEVGKLLEEIMLSLPGLPEGVFSQIYGGPSEAECLVKQDIDLIWFTGSTAAGKQLIDIAAKRNIKTVMELGGSNPAIIFPDVDLDVLVPKICSQRFTNCGQVCDAIKRLIVHQSIYKNLVEKIVEHVKKIKLGDPSLTTTELGPLVSAKQLSVIEAQVADAVSKGADVVIGGKKPSDLQGNYYLPTILTNITTNMRVWQEETFGPVLPIISFDSEDEALRLANESIYGLGAAVYSKDVAIAERIAQRIDACTIDINEGNHWRPCNLFGGFKSSGVGCEHGEFGFRELCRYKVIAK